MFSKKTRNLTVAVFALIMALTLSFGLFGFNTATQVNAADTVTTYNFDGTTNATDWTITKSTSGSHGADFYTTGPKTSSVTPHSASKMFAGYFGSSTNSLFINLDTTKSFTNVSKISMYINFSSNSNLQLSLLYSDKADFSSSTVIFSKLTGTALKNGNYINGNTANTWYLLTATPSNNQTWSGYFRITLNPTGSSGKQMCIDDVSFTESAPDAPVVEKYTVGFNTDGGTLDNAEFNTPKEYEKGTEITLPGATKAQAGNKAYNFTGWSCNGQTYQAGAKVTVNANMTFTAQWEEETLVSFTVVDGDNSKTEYVAQGAEYTFATQVGVTGYTPLGWTDGTKVYKAGDKAKLAQGTEVTALYAKLAFIGGSIRTSEPTGVRYMFELELYNVDANIMNYVRDTISGKYTLKVGETKTVTANVAGCKVNGNKIEMNAVVINSVDCVSAENPNKQADIDLCNTNIVASIAINVAGTDMNVTGVGMSMAFIAGEVYKDPGDGDKISLDLAKKYGYVPQA